MKLPKMGRCRYSLNCCASWRTRAAYAGLAAAMNSNSNGPGPRGDQPGSLNAIEDGKKLRRKISITRFERCAESLFPRCETGPKTSRFWSSIFVKEFNVQTSARDRRRQRRSHGHAQGLLRGQAMFASCETSSNARSFLAKGEWLEEKDLPPYVRDPSLKTRETRVFCRRKPPLPTRTEAYSLKTLLRAGK